MSKNGGTRGQQKSTGCPPVGMERMDGCGMSVLIAFKLNATKQLAEAPD